MGYSADLGLKEPPQIYKIIYHSNIAIDGGHDTVMTHVKEILTCSRSWNPKHGITGALMLNGENFSQVLEGPSHAVRALFGHIVCDRRHRNVELLQADYFLERDFSSWTMAFAGSPGEADITMASTHKSRDASLGDGASGVINLLRWLLDEQRVTVAIR